MRNIDVLDELRALGVRYRIKAGAGDVPNWFEMQDSAEWAPEFSRQVAEVLARHGMREHAEGSWVRADATEDQIRHWEELQRADHEYRDIHRTIAEHPDWSDEQVAEACGGRADYVAELRYEMDR